MDADERRFVLKDETYQIIGGAMEVINTLGHGLLEKPYERALIVEFGLRAIPCAAQRPLDVIYKNIQVGHYIPDLVAYGKIIVEVKCIDRITSTETAQVLNYLRIAKMPVGIILNFKNPRLEWDRVVLQS